MASGTNGGSGRRRSSDDFWSQVRFAAPAVLLIIAGFAVAYHFVEPAPPTTLEIATGSETGAYYAHGGAYAERLAVQGVDLTVRSTNGSVENLGLLSAESNPVPVAFLQGGIGEPADHPDLVSLGSVYFEPIWVFVRDMTLPGRLTELKGKWVAVGRPGSGTRAVALALLADNGLNPETADLEEIGGDEAAEALIAGTIDAAFFVTSVTSPTVKRLLATPGISLMNFERADAYLRRNTYLSKVVLPEGTVDLATNQPPEDTVLLAPAATVVARGDLHPALVDLMLLTMAEVHRAGGHLEARGQFPNAEFVTFPLADAASRFYRRGPPFLQRYLPFWAANLVDRLKIMLLPLLTMLYPLMRILPPAYNWRMRARVNRWYKDLQEIDDGLREATLAGPEAAARLDQVEHSVEQVTVPAGFAARAYTLRLHIDYLRQRINQAAN